MSLKALWETAQDEIRETVGKASYETWFSAVQASEKNASTLVVEAPDAFFKSWIVEHYQSLLEEIVRRHSDSPVSLEFSVNPNMLSKQPQPSLPKFEESSRELG